MSFHVWSSGVDWVIADSKGAVIKAMAQQYGYESPDEYLEDYPDEHWEEFGDDMTVRLYDLHGEWESALLSALGDRDSLLIPAHGIVYVEARAEDWVNHLAHRPQWFASTEF